MDALVKKLVENASRVVAQRAENSQGLREQIERKYVLVKFVETQGGTEIGVPLDMGLTKIDKANFDDGTGSVHLVGELTLNYVRVRCIVDLNVETLEGTGQLELVASQVGEAESAIVNTLH